MMPAQSASSLRRTLARAMLLTTRGALAHSLIALLALQTRITARKVTNALARVGSELETFSKPALLSDGREAAREGLGP